MVLIAGSDWLSLKGVLSICYFQFYSIPPFSDGDSLTSATVSIIKEKNKGREGGKFVY